MGLLDRVLGRPPKEAKSEPAPVEEPIAVPTPSPTSTPELTPDASATFGPPSLNSAAITGGVAAAGLPSLSLPTSSGRLYDPYEGRKV